MKIRLAKVSDSDELYALFKSASVNRSDLARGEIPQNGFFEYPLSYYDVALRAANAPFSLVIEDRNRIIAYLLGYDNKFAAQRVTSSGHADPVIKRFVDSPSSAVYLDQLFLQRGLPAFLAGRLIDTWEDTVRGERMERVVTSLPQGEWTNKNSLRFALDRGFSRKFKVDSGGVQLGVFSKPYINLDEEFKL